MEFLLTPFGSSGSMTLTAPNSHRGNSFHALGFRPLMHELFRTGSLMNARFLPCQNITGLIATVARGLQHSAETRKLHFVH